MTVASNIAKIQNSLLKEFDIELVRDWMLDTSEDFQAKHGIETENMIKSYLRVHFPEYANSDLLK